MKKANEKALRAMNLSDEQMGRTYDATQNFSFWNGPDGINGLWAVTSGNRFSDSFKQELNLIDLPDEAWPIVVRELHKTWQTKGTFREELELGEMSAKAEDALENVRKECKKVHPAVCDSVVTVMLLRRCLYVFSFVGVEGVKRVGRQISWTAKTSSPEDMEYEKKKIRGGFRELGFKDEAEYNLLYPIRFKIADLLIAIAEEKEQLEEKAKEMSEELPFVFDEECILEKKESFEENKNILNEEEEDNSVKDALIEAYIKIREALQKMGIDTNAI